LNIGKWVVLVDSGGIARGVQQQQASAN